MTEGPEIDRLRIVFNEVFVTDIVNALTRFERFLRDRGLPLTDSRVHIARVVFETREHFTAKQLLGKIRRRSPRIGTATVYRTLSLLVDSDLIAERDFQKGRSHYEQTVGARHHDHLLCTGCGDVVEFEDREIEELQRLVASRHRFAMTGHALKIYGLCPHCRGEGRRMGRESWERMRQSGDSSGSSRTPQAAERAATTGNRRG